MKHIVESFNIDHTKVTAPFIRRADEIMSPKGDIVTKLDVRFTQPNKEFMDMAAMHTLEHLLATFLREGKYQIIDFSPMGCQTGFYLTMFGRTDLMEFKVFFENCLKKVLAYDGDVIGAKEKECGNYKNHSLVSAKNFARKFLDGKATII
ncbi:MAG: S-ribosylhomocysteine lyase [Elusimicrobia bacterium]|nr:S-ribosylhomocysteine lyase [Elusimicrobiota bacterium]